MLGFEREGFEAFAQDLVLGNLLLLLLLCEREAGGDPGGWRAVIGCRPHWRLQHLHGIAPLAGGDGHLVEGRAGIGHGVGVRGVLPGGFRGPGFRFAVLKQKEHKIYLHLNSCILSKATFIASKVHPVHT